jgi:A/G-specific adenine glycosylase
VTANAATLLLQHYVDNFRRLPWRAGPGEPPADPYRVWLSEIMLQQTTVAAVRPRFERFLRRWPTVADLGRARDDEVLQEWAGLGYYARARNLIACAREITRRGGFPRTAQELRRLPGIGAYTAGAIAAIAFGEKAAAIDTNARRVIARLDGLADPAPSQVEARFREMMPDDGAGDFVQAMMDLGAVICRPAQPRCRECPLAEECSAYATGHPETFPARRPMRVRPRRFGLAYWIERDGQVWLVRRPASGLLGGMAALPGDEWGGDKPAATRSLGTVRHVFTHFALDLEVALHDEPIGTGWWHSIQSLDEAGLPTVYRRAVELVLSLRNEVSAAA